MTFKYKLADGFIKYRLRCNRGASYTNEIQAIVGAFSQGGIIILLVDRFLGILIPLWTLPLIWLFQKIVEYLVGRYDEKYLGLWHLENKYIPYNISPWNKDILGRVIKIEKMIEDKTNKI